MDLRRFFSYSVVALGAMVFAIGIQAYAFTQPSSSPPNNDAYAPINTGGTAQAKTGGLLLNTGNATNGLIVQYGNTGLGTASPGYKLDVAGQVRSSSGGYVFPDGTTQTTAASSAAGSYLPLAGGVMNSGSTITFNNDSRYGVGVGSAASNKGSIAVDTLETNPGGTLELNYYGGGAVTIGPGGNKPLYASLMYDGNNTGYYVDPASTNRMNYILADRVDTPILYDSNNTGYYVDPSYVSYINALQVAGGSLLANWPGYPRGIQQTAGAYLYPGFLSGQGSGWNTSYYLAGSTSWGLYSNTSLNAQGLYDQGNRVYSAANPQASVANATNATNATYGRYVYNNGAYSGSGWVEPSSLGVYYAYLGRLVYNNGAYSGSGWVEPSNLGVRYASSAGYANSAGSATDSSKVAKTGDSMSGSLTVSGPSNNWAGLFYGGGPYGLYARNSSGYYSYLAYSSYGLYSNGSVYAGGSISGTGLYDQGYRVYSPVNPPPATTVMQGSMCGYAYKNDWGGWTSVVTCGGLTLPSCPAGYTFVGAASAYGHCYKN